MSQSPDAVGLHAEESFTASPRSASFLGLAVVERQLILQLLDFTSLSRVYCCSRALSGEALHPHAGSFLVPALPGSATSFAVYGFDMGLSHYWMPADYTSYTLARAQLPVRLNVQQWADVPTIDARTVPAIMARLALFRKVHLLELGSVQWPERVAVQLLQQEALRTVRTVDVHFGGSIWIINAAVQRALFSLPSLTAASLDCTVDQLLPESLAAASSRLRQLSVNVASGDFRLLLPLCALPLERLTLRTVRMPKQTPIRVCAIALPQLTRLTVCDAHLSHAHARALFSKMPALTDLCIARADPSTLLLGCGDVGESGLPALRRCTLTNSVPSVECVRRFLWRFPRLDSFVLSFSTEQAQGGVLLQRFSRWGPPVRLDCEAFLERPQPQPSDDHILANPSEVAVGWEEDEEDL